MMFYYITIPVVFLAFIFVLIPLCVLAKRSDEKHPLCLPKGSIRSLLALGCVGTFLYVMLAGPLFVPNPALNNVVTALTGIANMVVGFYFGHRKAMMEKGG